ncbi:lipopolysaccharide biosynthesis protein [Pelosinus propionicus]|uniref:Membrane protein involved in the export of O-antigen and teichoic acid n=1 Tax=Pelosinus propionicus DSM 13327 TaxID=1123291 RepID=A0A1I4MP82_9FIRM|nr:oligosaccharide flippase family protein [Pelosinus propionicus]SFM05081.1 Membrane protein involved in the export of O-antigen and teichoic acid [Pelosinus propionicus DSM 13327]
MIFKNLYVKLIAYIKNRNFLKNVLTLMSGTIFSQIIMVLSMPVLTRIYSPEDFGIYAVFISATSIISVMATGRYELAIILPKEKCDSANLLFLCIYLSGMTVFFLLGIFFICGESMLRYFNQSAMLPYFWISPFYVFLLAIYQAFYYWFNREKRYDVMSKSRIIVSLINIFISIIIGMYWYSPWGLIIAPFIAQAVVGIYMTYLFIYENNMQFVNYKAVVYQAKRYVDFPRYLMVGHAIGNISQQLPVLLLNIFYGTSVVGYFSLGQRCINMPLNLITQSVGDVFRQRAAMEYTDKGECKNLFNKTMKKLAVIAIFPFIILLVAAPSLFQFIFGQEWRIAGVYTQILVPMYYLRCIASPLSSMALIAEKQKIDLFFQVFIISVLVFSMSLGKTLFTIAEVTIVFFCLGYCLIYLLSLYMSSIWSKGDL